MDRKISRNSGACKDVVLRGGAIAPNPSIAPTLSTPGYPTKRAQIFLAPK